MADEKKRYRIKVGKWCRTVKFTSLSEAFDWAVKQADELGVSHKKIDVMLADSVEEA